ncbi:ATP-binding cassette domain-containing protein [Brenneria populi subsp. brevivirga]|uniref:ABC transporter ATP-binding protein n=1 Tax=Brenneria populi TaxID=1505588 RepID=UPI002E18EE9E|nr:ATP-binding cassette domain-containing protein [Brenneria populi subsp. brevivirga]
MNRDTEKAPLLAVNGVSHSFRLGGGLMKPAKRIQALSDVSLTLRVGETLGLVGESGCGKSTLANIILGLNRPESGEVLLSGQPIRAMERLARASLLQPVFQDPYSSLNPSYTIYETVLQPLKIHWRGGEWRREVLEMLDRVGFPRRLANAYPGELSGGQRQRVAIARALILNPAALICDEPTSALDVSVQAQIINLLLALKREFNLAMVFISHNLAVVEHLSDRVCVMYQGKVVEQGECASTFANPRHDYTRKLLAATLLPQSNTRLAASDGR